MGGNVDGESLHYPDVVYGYHTSLYSLLDPAVVPLLERAIYLRRIGCFRESIEIFEAFDHTIQSHPVTVLEHSLVLYAQSRYKDGLAVLQGLPPDVLSDLKVKQSRDVAQGLNILLRVYVAYGLLFSQGAFSWARDCMDEVQEWLKNIPVEDYTDLQVIVPAACLYTKYLTLDRIPCVDISRRFRRSDSTISLQRLQELLFPLSTPQSIPIFLRPLMLAHGMVQRFCVGTCRTLGD